MGFAGSLGPSGGTVAPRSDRPRRALGERCCHSALTRLYHASTERCPVRGHQISQASAEIPKVWYRRKLLRGRLRSGKGDSGEDSKSVESKKRLRRA